MSQKEKVLSLLKDAFPRGVSNHEFIYVHGITRAAAVVFDLRAEGWRIDTKDEGDAKLCSYVLKSLRAGAIVKEDAKPQPLWGPPPEQPVVPAPAEALTFPCGCVRTADGRAWERRCARHER